MPENINLVFDYLDKEEIPHDKTEFLFQFQSHPEYPSLLSIIDTLSFFRVPNNAIKVPFSEIDSLPDRFIALLGNSSGETNLCLLERHSDTYFHIQGKSKVEMSLKALKSAWLQIVVLVEKDKTIEKRTKGNIIRFFPLVLLTTIFCAFLLQNESDLKINLFFVFPSVGIIFTLAALKDLFGINYTLINKFCTLSEETNCQSVVDSTKWKIFEYVNFSDLSLTFFTSQFIGLFLYIVANKTETFFSLQNLLIFSSVPVMLLSLYFQKFVEKKWCPICLAVISVLVVELIFLILNFPFYVLFSLNDIFINLFIFAAIFFMWKKIKVFLVDLNESRALNFKGNRFLRNYKIFKNSLVVNTKIPLPETPFVLGNINANTEITIITHPFCGFCVDAHKVIEDILERHSNNIKIKIIFRANIPNETENLKTILRSLYLIYIQDESKFKQAMHGWYIEKDITSWISLYGKSENFEKADEVFSDQYAWCLKNEINFTPAIFVNQYLYSEAYDREDLLHFINDLIEDNEF